MGSKWRKATRALGLKLKLNLCFYVPRNVEDEGEEESPATMAATAMMPSQTCSICLATMKAGCGRAIFTAECCHSFHFYCITSNVMHGNQLCPVCRAKWEEIDVQNPQKYPSPGKARSRNPAPWRPQQNDIMTAIRRPPPSRSNSYPDFMPLLHSTEPALFDDDEPLNKLGVTMDDPPCDSVKTIDIRTYPEASSFPRTKSCDSFTVLVQLKAAVPNASKTPSLDNGDLPYVSWTSRTPVDLVTVLDISGSMSGTKLALLKRAMGFVIQNLSSNDRLSVVAFSSTARRLFPLRRMTESGHQLALQAVNALIANGGTNIAEGLRRGAKVMEERKENNPVTSILLLSDGQDTYTVNRNSGEGHDPNQQSLVPPSLKGNYESGFQIPVHTFGFGKDHDASLMHSISEISGGTFSFIKKEAAIQDAFAQCIGGLLSVVVQQMEVAVECVHPAVGICAIKAGNFPSRVMTDGQSGYIDVGNLYADEERDFLIHVNIPTESCGNETPLLKVRCVFKDPSKSDMVTLESEEVKVSRPETVELETVSIEVDRQRNQLNAAEAMSHA